MSVRHWILWVLLQAADRLEPRLQLRRLIRQRQQEVLLEIQGMLEQLDPEQRPEQLH